MGWSARRGRGAALSACALLMALALTACGDGDGDGEEPERTPTKTATPSPSPTGTPDPADFVAKIDNPYLPLAPGTTFRYQGVGDEGQKEEGVVEVTRQTKEILGVRTTVVRDTVREDGEVVEDTFDWYAQDRDGNVWYFGEASKDLEGGKVVSTEGSWQAGKDGAEPGIVMEAHPKAGDVYRQEHAKGVAEDMGEVLGLDEEVTVAYGKFDRVLKTKDFTPLEPDVVEHKFYARGVGLVREEAAEGGKGHLELVEVTRP
ncbi:hypothetical protein ACQUSR_12710 [Streptomyces sp. P1-3]|uniref:hypothetical protein n=1 Tax=Streptomyces sp. P1-3 TaxID=3421658 RepID=UPI003D36D991